MTRYHWIMTVEHKGLRATADGDIEIAPGGSRRDTYAKIRKSMAREMGALNVVVLFFDLQPETLP
jgi:hypothetical protein